MRRHSLRATRRRGIRHFLWLLVPLACSAFAQSPPPALERAVDARQKLERMLVEWTWDDRRNNSIRYYTSRLSPTEDILTLRPDPDGVVMREPGGKASDFQPESLHALAADGQSWQHAQGTPIARVRDRNGPAFGLISLRSVGLMPQLGLVDVREAVFNDGPGNPPARKYKTSREGALQVVSAQRDRSTLEWWIDPEKEWLVVRAAELKDGKVLAEARSTPRRFGDSWYPSTVELFHADYKDGKEPTDVVSIQVATINAPDLPARLTPSHIGVEVGTNVHHTDAGGKTTFQIWDGEKPVSSAEYRSRVKSGELKADNSGFVRGSAREARGRGGGARARTLGKARYGVHPTIRPG
ncbi:MAG: hypothetical protein CHACPFDD_00433 [Phycisphaerae bacterium]|nr:hypothetical protein [Phycisphaerae bacterium]